MSVKEGKLFRKGDLQRVEIGVESGVGLDLSWCTICVLMWDSCPYLIQRAHVQNRFHVSFTDAVDQVCKKLFLIVSHKDHPLRCRPMFLTRSKTRRNPRPVRL